MIRHRYIKRDLTKEFVLLPCAVPVILHATTDGIVDNLAIPSIRKVYINYKGDLISIVNMDVSDVCYQNLSEEYKNLINKKVRDHLEDMFFRDKFKYNNIILKIYE